MANKNTRIQGLDPDVVTLASGASRLVTNKNQNQEMTQFVVSNLSTTAQGYVLYVCSSDGNPAVAVYAQSAITLETDSHFRILNPTSNGATVSYIVGQLFYLGSSRVGRGGDSGSGGSSGGTGSGGGLNPGPDYTGNLKVP